MENSKVFADRDVVGICEHITTYCMTHIYSLPLNVHSVRSFYIFLPELLVILFGSPKTRGLIQANLQKQQINALKRLLNIDSPFIQSLIQLSQNTEYRYDLTTESLPADVRKVLSTGVIQLLPKVYKNCVSASSASTTHSIDIQTAATIQSNLLPPNVNYEMRIQFNMLQFYLYYFSSLPTWTSTNEPFSNGILNKTQPIKPFIQPSFNQQPIQQQPPQRLTSGIYTEILDQYFVKLIPIHGNVNSSPVGRFYLDILVELWIRTPWISRNGKLDSTQMFYLSHFITYIVSNDLKNCVNRSNTYEAIRDELYMLISRLALNWERTDEYIQVIDLWCLWASAWKRGAPIRSKETEIYQPVQKGWVPFILDNIPYYFSMVEIFLERAGQFTYNDGSISLGGQLRSIYRIMNLLKPQGIMDILNLIEQALNTASIDTIYTQQLADIANMSQTDVRKKIQQASSQLAQLERQHPWKSKGFYIPNTTRSPALIKALVKLHEAVSMRESIPQGAGVSKPSRHSDQLQEAYKMFIHTFQLHNQIPALSMPSSVSNRKFVEIEYVGLSNGGFLTPDELEKVKQGRALCSTSSIPALGRRVQTVVRSYEDHNLVRWSIKADKYINKVYDEWIPVEFRSSRLPSKITTRPFANTVNFVYTCAFLLLLVYFSFKIFF